MFIEQPRLQPGLLITLRMDVDFNLQSVIFFHMQSLIRLIRNCFVTNRAFVCKAFMLIIFVTFNLELSTAVWSHLSQLIRSMWCFPFLCLLSWCDDDLPMLYMSHMYGFSPVCLLIRELKCLFSQKASEHCVHLYAFLWYDYSYEQMKC